MLIGRWEVISNKVLKLEADDDSQEQYFVPIRKLVTYHKGKVFFAEDHKPLPFLRLIVLFI